MKAKCQLLLVTRHLSATRTVEGMLLPVADIAEIVEVKRGPTSRDNDGRVFTTRSGVVMKDGTAYQVIESLGDLAARANA